MDTLITDTSIKKKQTQWLKWLLIVGIVIILNLFINSLIKVVYNEPQYTNFCEEKQVKVILDTKEECLAIGGQWTDDQFIQKRLSTGEPLAVPVIGEPRVGYCDPDFTCRKGYDDTLNMYERNVFVTLVFAGVLALIAGFFLKLEVLSLSLSLGGVVSLVIGSMRYWSRMDDTLRLVVLGFALAALVFVGIKKIRE